MLSMPVVDYVTSLYPSLSLNNTLIIGCQHILSTTHSMLRSLYPLGLSPQNVFLLGKCYSSNQSVWQEMLSDGIKVSPFSFSFEKDVSFDTQFSKIIVQFLENTLNSIDLSNFDRIIILDDGGHLIGILTTLMLDHRKIVGIEQTSSGYEKIKNTHLQFPVINVARSEAKLLYESPFISEIVIEKALMRIAHIDMDIRQVLIIGNGVIGSSIYTRIKDDYDVKIYDKANAIQEFDLSLLLQEADLIIGCTGQTSVPLTHHPFIKNNCVLLSASSSDREFDAVHMRKKYYSIKDCHEDLNIEGIHLLNCGFPVNFDGDRDSVAPVKIQLTRALLAAAILQGCEMSDTAPTLVPLDIELQRDIIKKYSETYPELIPSLVHPKHHNF